MSADFGLVALASWAGGWVMIDQATRAAANNDFGLPYQLAMLIATVLILGGCLFTGFAWVEAWGAVV